MVKIIALDGPHGVGKTTIMKKFKKEYTCIGEGFNPKSKTCFHPQDLYLEAVWVMNWFVKVEEICKLHFNSKTKHFENDKIIITDRSPYSAIIYSREKGIILKELIDEIIIQFRKKGIEIYCLYLRDNKDDIFDRILKRLKIENWRERLNENSKEWLEKVIEKYEDLNIWKAKFNKIIEKDHFTNILKFIKNINKGKNSGFLPLKDIPSNLKKLMFPND